MDKRDCNMTGPGEMIIPIEEVLVIQEEFTTCPIHGTMIEYFTDCPDCMDAEFYANQMSEWEYDELVRGVE